LACLGQLQEGVLRHAEFQDHFQKMSQELRLPKLVAMVKLSMILYMLAFAAPFKYHLKYGVQPFSIT
jgi:hypothetical protein